MRALGERMAVGLACLLSGCLAPSSTLPSFKTSYLKDVCIFFISLFAFVCLVSGKRMEASCLERMHS